MIVTAVERQRRHRRVNVFVDGRFALALGADLAAERGLQPGRAITQEELAALADAEAARSAFESALRLLSYRPRSEQELRQRLARKGCERAHIDATIERLRGLGYLDDAAFARFWIETRQSFRPRARWLLASELRRRGVAPEAAAQVSAAVSDEEAAYRAASQRLRALRGSEYPQFRNRLGRFLTGRGFSYDVARRTIERCWRELAGEGPEERGEAP